MRRPSTRTLLLVGVVVTLLLAGAASYFSSSDPDGLNRVAADHGMSTGEQEHRAVDGPLAGYQAKGVEDDRLSGLVAGVTGSLVVLALFGGLTLVLRRRAQADRDGADRDGADRDGADRDGADQTEGDG